jgi:hypothetical protein
MALDGVVSNNAKYTLDSFDVQVTLKDCEDKTKETNSGSWGKHPGQRAQPFRAGKRGRSDRPTCGLTICRGMSRCSVQASRAIADASSTGVLRRLGPRNSVRAALEAQSLERLEARLEEFAPTIENGNGYQNANRPNRTAH